MLCRVKQFMVLVVGWLLVAVGIAGLVLPVIPGWALIFVGAVMLGFDAASYLRLLDSCEARFPRFGRWIARLRAVTHREAVKASAAEQQRGG